MRNCWSYPVRTGLLLALSLLLFGCASGGSTGPDQSRASGETSRERAETKTRRAAKIELDGDYGFTLSEVVRIGSDVRRDYQQGVALLESGQLEAGERVLESVVERAPDCSAPCIAAAAPPSCCISMMSGIVPQIFRRPPTERASASSPIGDEGVIGYMAITSFVLWAI